MRRGSVASGLMFGSLSRRAVAAGAACPVPAGAAEAAAVQEPAGAAARR